jgi:DNA-binding response OmpR family regulator
MNDQIMIVDDDPSIRETVEIILSAFGYSVCVAENGRVCLEKLKNEFKGLILMDVMMPEMDGWNTIVEIEDRGLHGDNIICMLTAINDPGPKMEKLSEYIIDYIRKPFTSEELIEKVKEYLSYVKK